MLAALTACTDANSPVKDDGAGSKVPFDAGVEGLPEATPTRDLQVGDGDTVRMSISYVAKWVVGKKVRMLAYDGSVPGPTLKVTQGSEIVLMLENGTDLPASLHSHGVRLDHRFDGVPGMGLPPKAATRYRSIAYVSPIPAFTGTIPISGRIIRWSWGYTEVTWSPPPTADTGRP